MAYCANCGNPLSEGQPFCGSCGQPAGQAGASAPPGAVPPSPPGAPYGPAGPTAPANPTARGCTLLRNPAGGRDFGSASRPSCSRWWSHAYSYSWCSTTTYSTARAPLQIELARHHPIRQRLRGFSQRRFRGGDRRRGDLEEPDRQFRPQGLLQGRYQPTLSRRGGPDCESLDPVRHNGLPERQPGRRFRPDPGHDGSDHQHRDQGDGGQSLDPFGEPMVRGVRQHTAGLADTGVSGTLSPDPEDDVPTSPSTP